MLTGARCSMGGDGFLLRHKFDKVQVKFRKNVLLLAWGWINPNRGCRMPAVITLSLNFGPSPAMLPRAQTACSHTLVSGDSNSFMKISIPPENKQTMELEIVNCATWRYGCSQEINFVERRGSTVLLDEVFSNVVECAWPCGRLSAWHF